MSKITKPSKLTSLRTTKPAATIPEEDVLTEVVTNYKAALLDFLHSKTILVLVGALAAALLLFGIRFASLKDTHVHYHANFALYVNGTRDPFENFNFYEEVASCGSNDLDNPKIRVHLHKPDNYVVHVHDHAVTWGHLLANLGYTLGNDLIKTNDGLFIDNQDGKKLQFILNGEPVPTAANRTIHDRDVMLITYGNEDATGVMAQYKTIKQDAKKYDETADPAACSGAEPLDFKERLKQTFLIGNQSSM